MNIDERLVRDFLVRRGFEKVDYEPDGNVPPDFVVNDGVAIEVRRLNQNYITKNGYIKGLEEDKMPLLDKLKKLINQYGESENNKSWLLGLRFKRPIESWGKLEPKVRKLLLNVQKENLDNYSNYEISGNFEIKISPTPNQKAKFTLATLTDRDSSGFLLEKIESNLKLIIEEKAIKIANYRGKYKEWWLVLPDYIGYGLDNNSRLELKSSLKIQHNWDKVILINPVDLDSYFEI